jgi:hypothetical protein
MGRAGASVLKSDPISGYDCEFLADHWTGKEVPAAFGSKSKVLKIRQVTESSKGEVKLECTGIAVPPDLVIGPLQCADDLGIAIPSTTERLWPAPKFQDFLRLSRRSGQFVTTSS